MLNLVIFILSLILIILLFIMKSIEIYHGRKLFLERQFENFDAWIARTLLKIKFWWSHVNFKNTRLIILWIITNTHKLAVAVKRRFDHQQSHFFIKRNLDVSKHKNSPSFFLKDVSDYKKSLREGNENK
jgi:hypothetical protein